MSWPRRFERIEIWAKSCWYVSRSLAAEQQEHAGPIGVGQSVGRASTAIGPHAERRSGAVFPLVEFRQVNPHSAARLPIDGDRSAQLAVELHQQVVLHLLVGDCARECPTSWFGTSGRQRCLRCHRAAWRHASRCRACHAWLLRATNRFAKCRRGRAGCRPARSCSWAAEASSPSWRPRSCRCSFLKTRQCRARRRWPEQRVAAPRAVVAPPLRARSVRRWLLP